MKKLTVFIGRFSPFHNGHGDVLRRALQTSENVLVFIGSVGQARNIKNPFTYEERREMISSYVKNMPVKGNVLFAPSFDHPYNDQKWIESIQSHVLAIKKALAYEGPVFLTGANKDETTWYLKAFGDFFEKDFVVLKDTGVDYSATRVRNLMFGQQTLPTDMLPGSSVKFLQEFMKSPEYSSLVREYLFVQKYKKDWEAAPYPPTFVTVDACVIQSGHVLVNVRDNFPGKGLWALPGGFIEQHETLMNGCVRELMEETRIELSKAQLLGSIKSREVFDHPGRSTRGRTITTCFLFKLDDTKPLPKVKPQAGEVAKVMWIPIAEALKNTDKWYEDHLAILETMLGR